MGVFLQGCERARERVFWKFVFMNHTVQRARETHGLEARNARREAARVTQGRNLTFSLLSVSDSPGFLRVRAIGGSKLLVDFDQGGLCEDMRAGVSAGRADARAAAVNLYPSFLPLHSPNWIPFAWP